MTSATYEEAVDDISAIFKTAWDTTGFPVDYENIADAEDNTFPPDPSTPWARLTIRHSTGRQASLSGADGTKRYDRGGFLTVQVFVPAGEGLARAYQLGKVVTDAYEGTASTRGVWFRNARVNEIGPDGDWLQVNVLVDFNYDEVK